MSGSQTLRRDICHMQGAPVAQVEATKGALWDAFAETAVYMEVLHVQTSSSDSAKGEQQFTHTYGLARLHLCSSERNNPQSLPCGILLSALSFAVHQCTRRGRALLRSHANLQ